MKKALNYVLLTMLMLAAMTLAACGGGGDTAGSTDTTGPAISGHAHCVCGSDAAGLGDHTCTETTEWLAWPGINNVAEGGHYYLTEDLTGKPLTWALEAKHFSLCLNGHNVTTDAPISLNGSMDICDCAETQGTITSTVNNEEINGALMTVADNCALNIYGGNLTSAENCSVKSGGIYIKPGAAVKMYGGTVSNFKAINNGGNFYIDEGASLILYGGKISNKTDAPMAARGSNIYSLGSVSILGSDVVVEGGNADHGASIYMETAEKPGTFTMSAGTLTGGVTAGNAGNLYTKVNADITGGKIVNGSAKKGGNIFLTGGAVITVSNAEISGGQGSVGGNICISNKEGTAVHVEKGAVLANGTADQGGNIFVGAILVVNGGSITGGDIYMNNGAEDLGDVTINGGEVEKLSAGVGPWTVKKVDSAMAIHVLNAKDAIVNLNLKDLASDSAQITITANDAAESVVAYIDTDTLPANVVANGMKVGSKSDDLWKLVLG